MYKLNDSPPARRAGTRARMGALALASTLLSGIWAPVHAGPTGPLLTIDATTSAAGFKHPGLGISAAHLEYARQQARADVEPWKSYYAMMASSRFSSRTLLAANRSGTLDMPGINAYNAGGVQNRLITDSWGALTQATLYYMTGDNVYRANAMKIIRIWSNMDPAKTAYFADSHIHSGVPLYRLLTAAEILRSIPGDATYTAYNLLWSETDTSKLVTNLIEPMSEKIFGSNERYMNQHNYSLVGRLAGAIFSDNRARYDETIEWLTVNATSTRQYQNGAILPLNKLIEADHPLNTYGYAFIEQMEMSRDQAHGGDNVDLLTALARMATVQGTKVDPFSGKPSSDANAVSIYRFGGNRLLAGANYYARFMLGHEAPWVDVTGGSAKLSQAYRGRLYEVGEISELYNVYKHEQGVDVDSEAPYLATAAAHADGPVTFWDNKDPGPEAWLSFPPALAGKAPIFSNGKLELERKSIFLDANSTIQSDGSRTYASTKPTASGSTVVVHDIGYSNRNIFSPHGLMIRTNAVSTMFYSGTKDHPTPCQMFVPNTKGQWRYLVPDISFANAGGCGIWDNIIYYKFVGAPDTTIDFDHVNVRAQSELTAPVFPQGQKPLTYFGAQGVNYTASLAAKDANLADTLVYEAINIPAGATLDPSTGSFSWTPVEGQAGVHDIVISATDGVAINVLHLKLNVSVSREAAFQAAQDGYVPSAVYTTTTFTAYQAEIASLQQTIMSAPDAEFIAGLEKVQAAVRKLELVNPLLKGDNSLAYAKLVTSSLNPTAMANLTDDDYNTTTGDLRATGGNRIPFYIDFGENYRVTVNAFGIRARYNFANRSQGANVYGSHDNSSWVLLTETETTDTSDRDFAIETIPVWPSKKSIPFRYFKVQMDHPGPPTDPAYPGISSFSELHFHGVRYDLLVNTDVSSSIKITQSGITLDRSTSKYTGTVTFTNKSPETIAGPLQFRLDGLTSGVTLDNKTGDNGGAPYITLPDANLQGGDSITVTTIFSNPSKVNINYTPKLISGKY
jgi:hypothetical protein